MSPAAFVRSAACWALLAALLCVAGCGESEIPRVKAHIAEEILALPALYRTIAGRDVLAPGNAGDGGMVVLDEETGKLAWRVWECHNPTCPGKTGEGPTLFICPDENFRFKPAGEVEPGAPVGTTVPDLYCPHCAQQGGATLESRTYIAQYLLPETVARKAELEQEMQVRIDHVAERMGEAD